MDADRSLDVILRGCERLRQHSEARWLRPPLAPLGTRLMGALTATGGSSLEARVAEAAGLLMNVDAQSRGVAPFGPTVSVFGLADVVAALAKSVAAAGTDEGRQALAEVANAAADW